MSKTNSKAVAVGFKVMWRRWSDALDRFNEDPSNVDSAIAWDRAAHDLAIFCEDHYGNILNALKRDDKLSD